MSKDVNIDNYMRFYKEDDKEEECSPICREERQYALYLSNVLRYYGKDPQNRIRDNEKVENILKVENIFKACGFNNLDNLIIENVYYEATFMRDIFERNRKKYFKKDDAKITEENKRLSFNLALLKYCWCKFFNEPNKEFDNFIAGKKVDDNNEMKEYNYGARNRIPFLEYVYDQLNETQLKEKLKNDDYRDVFFKNSKFKMIVCAMMNAKPDIAVIYNEKGKRKLLFIECKYESYEDYYKYYSNYDESEIEKEPISQTTIQGYIADFLCNSYLKDVEMSEIMKNDNNESRMIRFVAGKLDKRKIEGKTKKGKIYGQISIKDLIEIEKAIFNK